MTTSENAHLTCPQGSAVMLKIDNKDWMTYFNYSTNLSNDYMVLDNVTEIKCKKACVDDCLCTVVTFEGLLCHKKRLPLIDGYQGREVRTKKIVKVKGEAHSPDPIFSQAPDEDEEGLATFSYEDREFATGIFKEELGKRAFGQVYKDTLPDGSAIAVKTLDKLLSDFLAEKQFRMEMSVLGMSHHKNLVQIFMAFTTRTRTSFWSMNMSQMDRSIGLYL
ncbi:hypothetical protein SUGI_1006790 [Cryptomeria japonica]|nr:hypothetical protein SUGI_1006790 [Cryptomeria japonica]